MKEERSGNKNETDLNKSATNADNKDTEEKNNSINNIVAADDTNSTSTTVNNEAKYTEVKQEIDDSPLSKNFIGFQQQSTQVIKARLPPAAAGYSSSYYFYPRPPSPTNNFTGPATTTTNRFFADSISSSELFRNESVTEFYAPSCPPRAPAEEVVDTTTDNYCVLPARNSSPFTRRSDETSDNQTLISAAPAVTRDHADTAIQSPINSATSRTTGISSIPSSSSAWFEATSSPYFRNQQLSESPAQANQEVQQGDLTPFTVPSSSFVRMLEINTKDDSFDAFDKIPRLPYIHDSSMSGNGMGSKMTRTRKRRNSNSPPPRRHQLFTLPSRNLSAGERTQHF